VIGVGRKTAYGTGAVEGGAVEEGVGRVTGSRHARAEGRGDQGDTQQAGVRIEDVLTP
jgi:uncharacterized protein YjbJ (UPF0337 family)